jgi:splicing factor 1
LIHQILDGCEARTIISCPTTEARHITVFASQAVNVRGKSWIRHTQKQIPGSMVIRKVEAPATPKEENTEPLQRKTKWGPDLASDPAVRKAKALAY